MISLFVDKLCISLRKEFNVISKQASRYRRRSAGKQIPPLLKDPSPSTLQLTANLAANDENKSIKRILEMQQALETNLYSFDIGKLTIGINKTNQSPQDNVTSYSEGSQTDIVMHHEVATDTKKLTLNSCLQINIQNSDMYSQTDTAFVKNKNIQTELLLSNSHTQTYEAKNRNISTQFENIHNDKCTQVIKSELEKTQNEYETIDENELYDVPASTEFDNKKFEIKDERDINKNRNKSDSPPLSSDKITAGSSNQIQFPFALFNPLAARLPIVGIYLPNYSEC